MHEIKLGKVEKKSGAIIGHLTAHPAWTFFFIAVLSKITGKVEMNRHIKEVKKKIDT